MQLSPSTVSSDPNNLLALLFPSATSSVPVSTESASVGELGFDDIFSALTPVTNPAATAANGATPAPAGAAPVTESRFMTSTAARAFAPTVASDAQRFADELEPADAELDSNVASTTPGHASKRVAGKSPSRPTPATPLAERRSEPSAIEPGAMMSQTTVMPFLDSELPEAPETAAKGAAQEFATASDSIPGVTRTTISRSETGGAAAAFSEHEVASGISPETTESYGSSDATFRDRMPDGSIATDAHAAFAESVEPEMLPSGFDLSGGTTSTRDIDPTRSSQPEVLVQTRAFHGTTSQQTLPTVTSAEITSANVEPRSLVMSAETPPGNGRPAPDHRAVSSSPAEAAPMAYSRVARAEERPRVGISRAPNPSATDGANFADELKQDRGSENPGELWGDKSFVTSSDESLTSTMRQLGTGVANSAAVMPIASSPTSPSHPAFEYAGASSAVAEAAAATSEATVAAPQTVNEAHRAVEAVLHAVDTVADREQTSVRLEFSVGDAELSVRVELHANEVRTTFRTESPELRTALAQEWQAVSGGDRAVRLAPAVFTSNEQSPADASLGDSASRQHERNPARHDDGTAPANRAFGREASFGSSASSTGLPSHSNSSALAPTGTARRLNLFA